MQSITHRKSKLYCKNFLLLLIFVFQSNSVFANSIHSEELISAGERTYQRFCAVCHGKSAEGNGSFSTNLKISPPNLTSLSTNNNGAFPWVYLYEVIDGRNIHQAHGTNEMPIWGDMFNLSHWSSTNIEHANTIVHGRIFELIMYLKSIQVDKPSDK